MRLLRTAVITIILGFALAIHSAHAQETGASHAFKTKTKSVAVFKDGYGFFLREGKASLYNGWAMTDYIPRATAGSFWFYSLDPDATVSTVRSTSRNEIRFEHPNELVDSLRHKMGLQIRVSTGDATTEGELVRVLDDMILLESGKQTQVIKVADIKSAQVLGEPLLLKVDSRKKLSDVTLRMGYLQQGISWTPSYTIDLISDNLARIILKATITNGVEDLQDATLYLVVGVPNFSMKGTLDPLTVHALGSSVLGSLPSGVAGPAQSVSNALQAEVSRGGGYGGQDVTITQGPVDGLQELYFYEKAGLEVLVGDVVMTTVMTGDLLYRSLFTWNADEGKEVYHHIVLKNKLDLPLTTGPAMVVQNGKPVSQDQLRYVPPGAEGRLKLTMATDIQTTSDEKEIQRLSPQEYDRVTYIPVVMQGRLLVRNHRKETVEVEVLKSTEGKITEASDGGDIQSQVKADQGLNPNSSVKWTIKVEPGKEKAVTYTYTRFVRAHTS